MSLYDKISKGETVYLQHPWEDMVAKLIPGAGYTLVKQKDGQEYSIKNNTTLATDFRQGEQQITEQQYLDYGKK